MDVSSKYFLYINGKMMSLTTNAATEDFYQIVVDALPLIDVRAPIEFAAGAFPMAVNLPLMDDTDRHLVGTCYKRQGREAAFALAEKRVSGSKKKERVAAWAGFVAKHPQALCYCFRGGMRSRTVQQWLYEATGKEIIRLQGGYKAFRRYLIEQLDPDTITAVPLLLGGRTGSGKTLLLRQLENSIDLEAIAHHRGSAFGRFLSPQPTQIDFENRLASALITHRHHRYHFMVLEDEGSYIGRCYIPKELAAFFKRDEMVLLESSLEERMAITCKEYVSGAQHDYCAFWGEETGLDRWYEDIRESLGRIKKRLGGERLKRVLALLAAAYAQQQASGDLSLHEEWVELLLCEYYDPMYDYQIEKGGRTILFKGNSAEVLQFFRELERKKPGAGG